MRLATYRREGVTRTALVLGDDLADLNRAYQAILAERGEPAPAPLAEALAPTDMLAFLEAGERALKAAREVLAWAGEQVASAETRGRLRREGILLDPGDVALRPPVPTTRKVVAMGLNYRDHAIETKMEMPTRPIFFLRVASGLVGPGEPVVIPRLSKKVDYEAELAVVIGRRARHVSAEEALDYVAGYSCFNDVSVRDYQMAGGQWTPGKNFDGTGPFGPYLVTKDEVPNPGDLAIRFRIGDEILQDSRTSELIFDIPYTIAYVSAIMTLEPGDVIATGTPAGVGFTRQPRRYLQSGETIAVEIEQVGVLENPVVAE